MFNVAIITYGVYRKQVVTTVFIDGSPEEFICAYSTEEQAKESAKYLGFQYYVKPLHILDRFINPDETQQQ